MTAKKQMVLSMTGTCQHNRKDTEIHGTARHSPMMANEPQDGCFHANTEFVCLPPGRSRRRCILVQLPK